MKVCKHCGVEFTREVRALYCSMNCQVNAKSLRAYRKKIGREPRAYVRAS